jgi:hypothetical protein
VLKVTNLKKKLESVKEESFTKAEKIVKLKNVEQPREPQKFLKRIND